MVCGALRKGDTLDTVSIHCMNSKHVLKFELKARVQMFSQEQKYHFLTVQYSTALGQFDLTYTVEAEEPKSQ